MKFLCEKGRIVYNSKTGFAGYVLGDDKWWGDHHIVPINLFYNGLREKFIPLEEVFERNIFYMSNNSKEIGVVISSTYPGVILALHGINLKNVKVYAIHNDDTEEELEPIIKLCNYDRWIGAEETAKYFPVSYDVLYLINEHRKGIKIEGRKGEIQYQISSIMNQNDDDEIYKKIKKIL
jgi:hypothetical protein